MELLQIKFSIFEYSREATILHICNTILQIKTFQKEILSIKKKKKKKKKKNPVGNLNYYLH